MENNDAVRAFAALAQTSRLAVFKLLVRIGPVGIPAGKIATELEVPPATLSFHLAQLVQAGLIESRRESRSIIYAIRVDGVRDLLGFLTQDCCNGQPELCGDLVQLECSPTLQVTATAAVAKPRKRPRR